MGQARLKRVYRFHVGVEFVALRDRAHVGDRLAGGDLSVLRAGAERGLAGREQVGYCGREFREHRGAGGRFYYRAGCGQMDTQRWRRDDDRYLRRARRATHPELASWL